MSLLICYINSVLQPLQDSLIISNHTPYYRRSGKTAKPPHWAHANAGTNICERLNSNF